MRSIAASFVVPPSQRSMWQSNSMMPFQPQSASVRNIHTVSFSPSGPTSGGKSSSNWPFICEPKCRNFSFLQAIR